MHCAGCKRNDNLGTYFGDLYQMYYLNGMMAEALTKSNKLGYVAAEKAAILGGSIDNAINPKLVEPLKQAMIKTEQYGEISNN